jgi:hypothetical protein
MTLMVRMPESSGGQIRSFPQPASPFHHDCPCSPITWAMNNRPTGGRSSET